MISKSKLPRLPREYYRSTAVVMWTHTFEDRSTGWVCAQFHSQFREILLHASARYSLACPVYVFVLMPDHWHLIWMGLRATSDQRLATSFLRQHLAPRFGDSTKLQDRPHDHVLRDNQRKRGAFQSACHYVAENPVRAGLCNAPAEWMYSGSVFPGYPDLNPRDIDFWERFWKIYTRSIA